jgi:hypothetical protein
MHTFRKDLGIEGATARWSFDEELPAKQRVEFTRDELQLLSHLVEGEIAHLALPTGLFPFPLA